MKKYRIIKLESSDDRYSTYCIQKKFLFFLWIDLNSAGEYSNTLFPTHYYQTLYEARTALRKFNVKKIIIDEYEGK